MRLPQLGPSWFYYCIIDKMPNSTTSNYTNAGTLKNAGKFRAMTSNYIQLIFVRQTPTACKIAAGNC
jgi:hypothetical protein